jgi:hypothetical protein
MDAAFAVVECPCGQAWCVELRHESSTCPRCGTKADLKRRRRLWQGDSAQEARAALATLGATRNKAQSAVESLRLPAARAFPRHDSPMEAAAAAGRPRNHSKRAEEVARVLDRLGPMGHEELVEALGKAGLDAKRAEAEVVRMLATDFLLEPRPGQYRVVE